MSRSHFNPRHFALDDGNSGGRKIIAMNRALHEYKIQTMKPTLDLSPPKTLLEKPAAFRRRSGQYSPPRSPSSSASSSLMSSSSLPSSVSTSRSPSASGTRTPSRMSGSWSSSAHEENHSNHSSSAAAYSSPTRPRSAAAISVNPQQSTVAAPQGGTALDHLRARFGWNVEQSAAYAGFVNLLCSSAVGSQNIKEVGDWAMRDAFDQVLFSRYNTDAWDSPAFKEHAKEPFGV
eukprot:ANDGO_00863.mRNA.1 hypothetical protein